MPRIPNPAGGLMRRVDETLENVEVPEIAKRVEEIATAVRARP